MVDYFEKIGDLNSYPISVSNEVGKKIEMKDDGVMEIDVKCFVPEDCSRETTKDMLEELLCIMEWKGLIETRGDVIKRGKGYSYYNEAEGPDIENISIHGNNITEESINREMKRMIEEMKEAGHL